MFVHDGGDPVTIVPFLFHASQTANLAMEITTKKAPNPVSNPPAVFMFFLHFGFVDLAHFRFDTDKRMIPVASMARENANIIFVNVFMDLG